MNDEAWLYTHLGTIAQIAGFAALLLIGFLTLVRKRKSKKLDSRTTRTKQ